MARKTKYTPETVRKVVEAIKMGATYELAAGYAGIGHTMFYEWMKTKAEFSEAIQNAEGVAAMVWLAKIEKAATEGAWQAAAWKLERRYPHQYGRNVTQMEVTGKDGGAIQVIYKNNWRGVLRPAAPDAPTAAADAPGHE